ncbi:unnamed protein product [Urochloa humidicola]
MASEDEQKPLHLLFFPFIAPGHLIPVADMAAMFASRGVRCSILTTPANAAVIRPAVDRANAALRCAGAGQPAIGLSTIPFPDVGLPPGVESAVGVSTKADVEMMLEAIQRLREPFARFLVDSRPDAAVADSFFPWAADAAAEHGVPRLCFLGTSMFARACHDSMIRHNPVEDLAAGDDDPDTVVSLPALPHRVELRRGQLMDPRRNAMEWSFDQLVNDQQLRRAGAGLRRALPHDAPPPGVARGPGGARQRGLGGGRRRRRARAGGGKVPPVARREAGRLGRVRLVRDAGTFHGVGAAGAGARPTAIRKEFCVGYRWRRHGRIGVDA